jgi:hypothetical protein
MPITLNGDTGIQTPMYNGTITANAVTPSVNMKNRIINGACVISQRWGTSAVSDATNTNPYTVDRWSFYGDPASKVTLQQNQDSVTPPVGFINYMGLTSSSAYTPAAGDSFRFQQIIEGLNVADLAWGTASAKTVTLSFWVRSSLTGTFGGALSNSALNRSYPFSYTINAANTWEYETITIAGDTTGTWLTTNGNGIRVFLDVGCGSTTKGPAGAWASAFYAGVTGGTNVVATNGATFQFTGVQLEVGSTATSFDYRPYGTELQLCQRYFSKSFSQTVVPADGINTYTVIGTPTNTSDLITQAIYFPVTMRTAPTITFFRGSVIATSGLWSYFDGSWQTPTGTNTNQVLNTYMAVYIGSSGAFTAKNCLFIIGNYTASAEL